jgi:RimJ/RimL family protein N-acetyltransferase
VPSLDLPITLRLMTAQDLPMLHELLFAEAAVTRIQTDPAPDKPRAIRCYEKAGFRRVKTIRTPDGEAVYMVRDRPEAP